MHTPNGSFLSDLIKKLAKKTTLNMVFGTRPSNKSKGTGLRLIHAKFEKDPVRNGGVIHVWRGSNKKALNKHKNKQKHKIGYAVVDYVAPK